MKALLLLTMLTLPTFAHARTGGGSSVGTGNPAAQLCLDLGGQLERTRNEHGEDANCVIDEWKLFDEMSKQGLVGHIGCGGTGGAIGCANPAAVNCSRIGGKYRIVTTPEGEAGMCVMEEWALWKVFHRQ